MVRSLSRRISRSESTKRIEALRLKGDETSPTSYRRRITYKGAKDGETRSEQTVGLETWPVYKWSRREVVAETNMWCRSERMPFL